MDDVDDVDQLDQGAGPGQGGGVAEDGGLTEAEAAMARLRERVETARSRPMSSSVVVDRAEVLGLLDAAGTAVRSAVGASRQVLEQRESLLARARTEAERIVSDARRERDRMIGDTDVYRVARREAERLLEKARADDRAMRQETDEYVDAKLANFEVTLARTSEAVRRGRERLAGRSDYADIAPDTSGPGGGRAGDGGPGLSHPLQD